MSTKKFLLLTLKMHVEVTQVQLELEKIKKKTFLDFNSQAFCHSAPQLVTQLAMIWSGVSPTNGFNTKSKTNININKQ